MSKRVRHSVLRLIVLVEEVPNQMGVHRPVHHYVKYAEPLIRAGWPIRPRDIETGKMLVKQLEVLGQENRALREAAGRASALEREREALLARLRVLSFAAGAALLLILILVYLVSR